MVDTAGSEPVALKSVRVRVSHPAPLLLKKRKWVMRIKNLIAAIKYQPLKEWFVTGNAWGIFSKNSHVSQRSGEEKICFPTESSALKAAVSLNRKNGTESMVCYKCVFCDGWHIGNERK